MRERVPPPESRHARAHVLAAAIALSVSLPLNAGVCDLTVGSDLDCDAATLEAALFVAAFTDESETICNAQNHTETNVSLSLLNWSSPNPGEGSGPLEIRGGWSSCSLGGSLGRTTLQGNGSDPVIDVTATAGRTSEVTLHRLELTDGSEGLHAHDGATVFLENSSLNGNGRGIRVQFSSLVDLDFNTAVGPNTIPNDPPVSSNGASILCFQSTFQTSGLVIGNVASTAGGGGLFANECTIQLRDGAWFQGNRAVAGGGLDVGGGTVVQGGGNGPNRVLISDNEATSSLGGGIYARTGAQVLLGNVEVVRNEAVTVALLDRLTQGAHILTTKGASYRSRKRNSEGAGSPNLASPENQN